MLQLISISTARPALDQHEIARILATARRRNAADGITGLLIHDGVRFLQALEGDADAIEASNARIRTDPRHRAPAILSRREISSCEFGDSPMAWSRVAAIDHRLPLTRLIDSLVCQASDCNTRALFRDASRIERRAA